MEQDENYKDTLAKLIWQCEAGADEVIGDVAGLMHWKVGAAKRVPQGGGAQSFEQPPTMAFMPEKITPYSRKPSFGAMDAPPECVKAVSLSELKEEVAAFNGCNLKQMAMNFVFADGNPTADIMIIGDVPAEGDDRQGKAFAGAHGALLDRMLSAIGLSRQTTYLTNLVFWRPPGGRSATQEEVEACLPFTIQHIQIVRPKLLILLGGTVTKNILRNKKVFSQLRGRWQDYEPLLAKNEQERIRCLPMHPPAYLLRLPAAKRQAWQDLLKLKAHISS